MTKKEIFINKIQKLFNIKLENEKYILNNNRNRLYTKIDKLRQEPLYSYLKKNYIVMEHINNYYWIFLNKQEKR